MLEFCLRFRFQPNCCHWHVILHRLLRTTKLWRHIAFSDGGRQPRGYCVIRPPIKCIVYSSEAFKFRLDRICSFEDIDFIGFWRFGLKLLIQVVICAAHVQNQRQIHFRVDTPVDSWGVDVPIPKKYSSNKECSLINKVFHVKAFVKRNLFPRKNCSKISVFF